MSETQRSRRQAIQPFRSLASAPDPAFDEITALAAYVLRTPISLVSLLDRERQWFMGGVGRAPDATPRDAFFEHVLALPPNGVFVVEDAREDPDFAVSPFVTGPPFARFYAGAMITDAGGRHLGVLGVIDTAPRTRPPDADLERLQSFARFAADKLERGRTERDLAEQRRLLAMTEALSAVGHWRTDLKTGSVAWSDEIYRITGYSHDGPLDLQTVLGLLKDTASESVTDFERAVREHGTYDEYRPLRRPDGEVRELHSIGACEVDEAGEAVAILGVVQDVTESQRALATLRRSQARYRLLAENMADVVASVRLDGSADYVSPTVSALLGYSPEAMSGRCTAKPSRLRSSRRKAISSRSCGSKV